MQTLGQMLGHGQRAAKSVAPYSRVGDRKQQRRQTLVQQQKNELQPKSPVPSVASGAATASWGPTVVNCKGEALTVSRRCSVP